jgi:hypothetical protein
MVFNGTNSTSAIQTVLEALTDNRSLEFLSIEHTSLTGIGATLAAMLKANKALKHLKLGIDFDWESGFEEISVAVQALLHNTTLESLDLAASHPFHPRRTNPQLLRRYRKIMA